jgi:hypothetical protein
MPKQEIVDIGPAFMRVPFETPVGQRISDENHPGNRYQDRDIHLFGQEFKLMLVIYSEIDIPGNREQSGDDKHFRWHIPYSVITYLRGSFFSFFKSGLVIKDFSLQSLAKLNLVLLFQLFVCLWKIGIILKRF